MQKLISIIIPCFNVGPYLERCIRSLINQTIGVEKLELIFVNDASSDNTLEILLDYERLYPESILVVNLETNMRQGGARNIGIEYSGADYIGFVDADDWVEPTMFEKIFRYIIEEDCDIVTCDSKRDMGTESIIMGPTGKGNQLLSIDTEEQRKSLMAKGTKGYICTKIYKKDFLIENNITFPEHLTYEDNFFMAFCLLYARKIYIVEEYLYHYFLNLNSTVTAKNSMHHLDRLEIELMKLQEYQARGVYNLYYREIEYNFLVLFYVNTLHILFTRFDKQPYPVYLSMKENVLKIFPDYINNPYLDDNQKSWLALLDMDITKERLERVAYSYKNRIRN